MVLLGPEGCLVGAEAGAGEYLDAVAGGCAVDVGAGEYLLCAAGGAGRLLPPCCCELGE
jgi:hypothetical protein